MSDYRDLCGKEHWNFKGNEFIVLPDGSMQGKDAKGNIFIIDADDYEYVSLHRWSMCKGRKASKGSYFNARMSRKAVGGNRMKMLHNYIWEYHNGAIPQGLMVDHINQLPYDNRLSNLRLVNKAQNSLNSTHKRKSNTGIRGVNWYERKHRFRVYINVDGKRIELGCYKNMDDAIRKRLQAEHDYLGEFAPQRDLFEKYEIN